jgi:hypothetical protein
MAKSIVDNLGAALTKAKRDLQKEAKQISEQISRIDKILRSGGASRAKAGRRPGKKRGGPRRISAAGRARIAAAQRKRWAKVRAAKKKAAKKK